MSKDVLACVSYCDYVCVRVFYLACLRVCLSSFVCEGKAVCVFVCVCVCVCVCVSVCVSVTCP